MEQAVLYELIGYLASLLVAISLMMSAIVKLRIINLIGSLTFTIYGVLIDAWPVALMNALIVFVNIYYLIKIYRDDQYFQLLKTSEESTYLKKFLDFYNDHIKTYQPQFSKEKSFNYSMFVLSDMVPAGLILGNIREDGTLEMDLDFVIPSYRDFKIGRFLFEKNADELKRDGIEKIVTPSGNSEHNEYLRKVGFEKINSSFVKTL
ncbi:GNAT family N-acetyltransferase [Rhodohalobacter halophilus]|uniref:GNAT family N-acetyltransferase n=1 Tax=Rhodohalobacter halophilus TaxID=1812810 RepID=UPI00083FA090|nr:GNAT family N-acetyltransferase [Rhodohalobacter halophilus]